MSDNLPPLGIQRVKVVAVSVIELERANRFYRDTLGLEPAFEGAEQVGWQLGQVILMLKPDWAVPTAQPNPRVTLATAHAPATLIHRTFAIPRQSLIITSPHTFLAPCRMSSA